MLCLPILGWLTAFAVVQRLIEFRFLQVACTASTSDVMGGRVNSRWLQVPATIFTERVNLSSRLTCFAFGQMPSSSIFAISPTISTSIPCSARPTETCSIKPRRTCAASSRISQ
jgi:hypothetical protein